MPTVDGPENEGNGAASATPANRQGVHSTPFHIANSSEAVVQRDVAPLPGHGAAARAGADGGHGQVGNVRRCQAHTMANEEFNDERWEGRYRPLYRENRPDTTDMVLSTTLGSYS